MRAMVAARRVGTREFFECRLFEFLAKRAAQANARQNVDKSAFPPSF
jgi:hypothetical protein